ncbi:MAG: hypothetical protein Kow0042_17090 [Calditrichia bacterium]
MGLKDNLLPFHTGIDIVERKENKLNLPTVKYLPRIQIAEPQIDPQKFRFKGYRLYKVVEILDNDAIKLDSGLIVKFLEVKIKDHENTRKYFQDYILGKNVS